MRVCIVDDHEVVREGLRMALTVRPDPPVEIVGEAASGADAVSVVRRTSPDVVLVDYRLPDTTGDELCRRLLGVCPGAAVVVLTTFLSEDVVQRCLSAGAAGFVTKAAGLDELRRVLAAVVAGDHPHESSSAIVRRLGQSGPPVDGDRPLTGQQARVLELTVEGLTYAQIAQRLHLSVSTVRFHIQGIKDRLGASSRSQLVAVAIRRDLVTQDNGS